MLSEGRAVCARCRRPASVCYCHLLPVVPTASRVVFLQHPRERKVAISTCRMAHLALAGSELHHGTTFVDDAHLAAILAAPAGGVYLLYPSAGAVDPRTLAPGALRTLIVVDGTWSQARKLVARSPQLAAVPRLGLAPSRPSNYRIRREPADHCVSTIEAVVEVLGLVEGQPDRYRPLLGAFDHMIDTQIARTATREGPPRRRRPRLRPPRPPAVPAELTAGFANAVALYAEANAGGTAKSEDGPGQLLQIAAVRPATGERFEALVIPRGPLAPAAPSQLELPAERFAAAEPLDAALARFAAFLRPDDLLCGWGFFAVDLWRAEAGAERRPFVDLRLAAARVLGRRPGGVEQAADALAAPAVPTWTEGRAGRRIAALESVLLHLAGRTPR